MTRFGKALVYFNLAFALLLAAWSFSLYANAIDWTDRKGKQPGEPGGEYANHEAQLADAWQGIPPAQVNWLRSRKKLLEEEAHLVADRVWYDEEMRHVFFTATVAKPIGELVVADKDDAKTGVKKGQIALDAQGRPLLAPARDRANKPLESLAAYNKRDDDLLKEIRDVLTKHEAQIKELNEYTDKINGDKAKGIRGLHQRIEDERAKTADVMAEQKLLRPMLINTVVDLELIHKRHSQLIARIAELKKIKIAGK